MRDEYTIRLEGLPQVGSLDQYFGAWAVAEDRFRGIVEHVGSLDLVAHVNLNQQPAAVAAASSRATAAAEVVDGVAIVSLSGVLMKSVSSLSSGTSTVNARRQVRQAIADPAVKAILLQIDSPGGTVAGTSDLADEITAAIAAGKPCYAAIEDLCCSAAYWIASQCDKIFANTTASVGSIGTYATIQDYSATAAKQGVKVHVVRAGAMKGVGTPGTEITPEHLAELQRHINALNAQFVAAVAKGRKFSSDTANALADGRVHVGSHALALGLIDGIQSFDATLSQLRAFAPAAPISNPIPNTPKRKGTAMAGDTPTPQTKDNIVQPATIHQIKAAFPKASGEFVVAQLERSATLEQARGAWAEALQAQIEAKDAELANLKKSGAPVLTTGKKVVHKGLEIEVESISDFEGDAKAQMSHLVGERMREGMTRLEAVKVVARANPALHQAYLEQTNKPRTHGLIALRFEEL